MQGTRNSLYYTGAKSRQRWPAWMGSGAAALGMTLVLFSVMPALLHPERRVDFTEVPAARVNVIRMPRSDAPVVRKTPKSPESDPEKPKPPSEMAHQRLPTLSLSLPFKINPNLASGPDTPEMPPMASAGLGDYGLPEIFAAGDLDQPLTTLVRVPPVYPFLAKQRNIQGWVKVRFVITTRGTVDRATIVAAQPAGIFEQSVARCITQWRFRPGTIAGEPVSTWAETTVKFELK